MIEDGNHFKINLKEHIWAMVLTPSGSLNNSKIGSDTGLSDLSFELPGD